MTLFYQNIENFYGNVPDCFKNYLFLSILNERTFSGKMAGRHHA